MPTIIKKGTNPSAFRLKNGKTILISVEKGGGDVLNFISEDDFKALMREYGSFIAPRIISDKNPHGCFIISAESAFAKDMGSEIGDEIKDNSAPVEIEDETTPETPIVEVSEPVIDSEPQTPVEEENPSEIEEIGDEIKDNSDLEENSLNETVDVNIPEETVEQPREVEEKSKKGKK